MKRIHFGLISLAGVTAVALLGVVLSTAAAPSSPFERLKIFAAVLSAVERYYVEPVNRDELVYGALRGMLRALDPHSAFLDPEEHKLLLDDTKGEFGGVGLEVSVKGDALTVIVPIKGSPAERAGLRPGDVIIAIGVEPTRNMTVMDAVRRMRGAPKTRVVITVVRGAEARPFEVALIREVIRVPSAEAEVLAPGLVWLKLMAFQEGTTNELRRVLAGAEAKAGKIRGLVLDLRQNPGGVLGEAVAVADLFLDSGVIVSTRGRGGQVLDEAVAKRLGTYPAVPLVVIVDGASASASEIVAGALKDQGRAVLVGARTFGKGSVQSIIDVGGGCGLKLTIARYYTPSGHSIQAEGIEPDIIVPSRTPPKAEGDAAHALWTEADLPGHLKNGANKSNAAPAVPAVTQDFQLSVALGVLQGLVRARGAS